VLETTALGAASWRAWPPAFGTSREEIAKQWKVAKRFEPKMKREKAGRRIEELETGARSGRGVGGRVIEGLRGGRISCVRGARQLASTSAPLAQVLDR